MASAMSPTGLLLVRITPGTRSSRMIRPVGEWLRDPASRGVVRHRASVPPTPNGTPAAGSEAVPSGRKRATVDVAKSQLTGRLPSLSWLFAGTEDSATDRRSEVRILSGALRAGRGTPRTGACPARDLSRPTRSGACRRGDARGP